MRSIDDLEIYKDYGLVLTPVKQDKRPVTKDDKWYYSWPDEDLLIADRLGFYHKQSNVFTLDFDDKTYMAHRFICLFPKTFSDGKKIYEDDFLHATHLTYKVNGQGALKFKYPPKAKGKEDGLLIETLTSTHTLFTSNDGTRGVIPPITQPQEVDLELLRKYCSLTCFMVEVSRNFPPANVGARDEAHLRLTGALAKLDEKEYPTDLLDKFHERFCEAIGDTKEIKNRLKINRQRKALANGKKVYGITELRSHLDSELEAYNLLFEQKEEELQEANDDPTEYPLIDGLTLDATQYEKVDYLMNPILSTRSFNQIYGWYESGKTIFGLALSIAMASGQKFLDWECDNPIPSIYVESELPGDVFKSYRWSILQGYLDEGKKWDAKNHFTLTHDDLTNAGFKYGFHSIAVAKQHGKDAAKDYGRKGRQILLDLFMKIKNRTGKAPFYFLDNMSRLATFDENKQPDWEPFINWGIDLKNKGIPGCFLHHANKGEGKGSSGSSYIGRLLDTSIQLTKLEDDYRFKMPGNKNLQSSIRFDKSRGFGGSSWANKRILTMDENGKWRHYPFLKQISFVILGLHEQGLSQEQIRSMAKEKEVRDMKDNAYSPSHVDKLYKELVSLKLIKKERQSHCWNCKQPISHTADERCQNCDYGIICNNELPSGKICGKCHCEKPKRKK